MKRKENSLVLFSLICVAGMILTHLYAKDFSLRIWYLTRIWMVLFVCGMLKALCWKWRQKLSIWKVLRKKGKYLLLIGMMLCIVLICTGIWGEPKESVKKLKRNQAVMAMVKQSTVGDFGERTELYVINREGRWKRLSVYEDLYKEIAGGEWEEIELTVEILDKVLASPKIPYQLGKVYFTKKELNKAIRQKDVSYYYITGETHDDSAILSFRRYYYYNVQGVEKRNVYKLGEKATENQWKYDKEVLELCAIYKKWTRVIEHSPYGTMDIGRMEEKEKWQLWKGLAIAAVSLLFFSFLLGSWDGFFMKCWWRKPCLERRRNNLLFAIGLFLFHVLIHGGLIWNGSVNLCLQFFLSYCFTMGVWCFKELGSWRQHCGILINEIKYKSIYRKGNLFLVVMGCCWFWSIIDYLLSVYIIGVL